MSSAKPSTTTQTTEVKLPEWVNKASESNYGIAKLIAGKPLQQYEGARVATPSDMTNASYDYLMRNVGASDPLYEEAANRYQSTFGDLDVNKYLNPYLANVETGTIDASERARKLATMQGSDTAKSSGAFGGSRHGVAEGVTNAEYGRNLTQEIAKLRAQGYDSATATALAEKQGTRDSAAGLTNVGTTRQASMLTDVGALGAAGKNDEAYKQRLIDADMSKFDEAKNYDLERLNTLMAALGMSPYGKTESSTRTGTSEQGGTDWASTILGGAKLLGGFMGLSDERDKTDIKKLGEENEYGFPLYSYRYKDDPKSYPKVVGPMAQDIEKKLPHLVKEIGGHKTVPLGLLSNGL